MSARTWLLLALAAAALGWWYSPVSPRTPPVAAAAPGVEIRCPQPPVVARGEAPLQSPVPPGLAPFRLAAATLEPLAGFSVEARVLSREDYHWGREARLSPTDLALGWGPMASPALAGRLSIAQSGRWYRYAWRGAPPLPPRDIARSSANMHLIPADAEVARALGRIGAGDRVRIDGWLVEARSGDGWRWRSSLSREDTGNGACELVYACRITPEHTPESAPE